MIFILLSQSFILVFDPLFPSFSNLIIIQWQHIITKGSDAKLLK